MATENGKKTNLNVQAGALIGSTYSQVISFTISDVDATFEFVYVNPQSPTQGQSVARVTTPRSTAEELAKIITETIKKHEDNKKGN